MVSSWAMSRVVRHFYCKKPSGKDAKQNCNRARERERERERSMWGGQRAPFPLLIEFKGITYSARSKREATLILKP